MTKKEWNEYIKNADLTADERTIREYARVYFEMKEEYKQKRYNRVLGASSLILILAGVVSITYNIINLFIIH